MAAFREHVTFSSSLGVGYAAGMYALGANWVDATLGGMLCGAAGMLPDLDSASGRPVREMFALTAAVVPMMLFRRFENAGLTAEETLLVAATLYVVIRFGAAWIFRHVTVHRGMFHSIPAAIIAAEIVFLAHASPELTGRLIISGGVLLGFMSHLILDEIYSVDISGIKVRLAKSAGSAVKFFSQSFWATSFTYILLIGLTYLIFQDEGVSQSALQLAHDYQVDTWAR